MKKLLLLTFLFTGLISYGQTIDCFLDPTDTCNTAECNTYGVGPGPQPTGWAYREYMIPAGYSLDSIHASFNRLNQDIYKLYYCNGCGVFDFASSTFLTGAAITDEYDVWFDLTGEGVTGSGILSVFAPTAAEPTYWDSLCIATTQLNAGITEFISSEKAVVKIVDFMGRETEFKPNTPLIYIYSDGTRERVMKLEE